jgi:hypothetical protein
MAASSRNLKVTADIRRNRLIFKFADRVTKKDLDSLYTDVRFCVADLKPGFDVITDFSECKFGNLNCLSTTKKIMSFLVESKVGEIVRITRKTSLIHKQILNFSARQQGYWPLHATTLEEAEKLLEDSDSEDRPRFRFQELSVEYSLDEKIGKGRVHELSPESCVIIDGSPVPALDDKIEIQLELFLKKDTRETFKIKSRVIKIEANLFFAEFTDFDEDQRKKFWKCLAYEVQREL